MDNSFGRARDTFGSGRDRRSDRMHGVVVMGEIVEMVRFGQTSAFD
jgi:hypothetical protein